MGHSRNLLPRLSSSLSTDDAVPSPKAAFDATVLSRYACKRFKRFDNEEITKPASRPNPSVVQQALHCLELARRAPSAFNTQPYKVILVHSPEQREAISPYCLGPNARRVLDADCTAIFLADRQILRTLPRYRAWLADTDSGDKPYRELSRISKLTTQFYIALFSSGYPLPRVLSAIFSFCFRAAFSLCNLFSTLLFKYPLPTLSSSETWSSKQVMLVAMTYMLGCASRGLSTIPMEGISASGIRRVLKIPSRYAIPIIVATGLPYHDAKPKQNFTERYPMDEIIFGNSFGEQIQIVPQS